MSMLVKVLCSTSTSMNQLHPILETRILMDFTWFYQFIHGFDVPLKKIRITLHRWNLASDPHGPVIRQGFLWQMQMSLLVRWTTSSWPASAPFFWKRSPWGYGPKLSTSQNGRLIHLNTKNTLNSVVCQVFDFDPYPIKCFAETVQLGLLKVEPGELPGNSFVGQAWLAWSISKS